MVKDLSADTKQMLKFIEKSLTTNMNVLFYGPESSLNQLTEYLQQSVSEDDAIGLCKNLIEYRQKVLRKTDEEYEKMKSELEKNLAVKLIGELVAQEGSFRSMEKELANQINSEMTTPDSKPRNHWLLGDGGNQFFRDSIVQPENWDFDGWLKQKEESKSNASPAKKPVETVSTQPPTTSPDTANTETKTVPLTVLFNGPNANLTVDKSAEKKNDKKKALANALAIVSAINSLPKPIPKEFEKALLPPVTIPAITAGKKQNNKAKAKQPLQIEEPQPVRTEQEEQKVDQPPPVYDSKKQPWNISGIIQIEKPLPVSVAIEHRAGNMGSHDAFRKLKFLTDKKTKKGLANVSMKSAINKRLSKFSNLYEFRLTMANFMNLIVDNQQKDTDMEKKILQLAISYAMDENSKFRKDSIDNALKQFSNQLKKNEADVILMGLQRMDQRYAESETDSPLQIGYDKLILKLEALAADIQVLLKLIGTAVDFTGYDKYL